MNSQLWEFVITISLSSSLLVSKMKVIVTGELCKILAQVNAHFAQEHLVFSEPPFLTRLSGRPPITPSLAWPTHVQGESEIIAN